MSIKDDVNTAGDVEVEGYRYRIKNRPNRAWTYAKDQPQQFSEEFDIVPLYAQHVVTRMTAERDGLLAEVERLNELLAKEGRHFDAVWQKGLDLQSELTKARELNEHLYIALSELDSTLRVVAVAGSKTALSSLRTLAKRSLNIAHGVLSNQSAPAAKTK